MSTHLSAYQSVKRVSGKTEISHSKYQGSVHSSAQAPMVRETQTDAGQGKEIQGGCQARIPEVTAMSGVVTQLKREVGDVITERWGSEALERLNEEPSVESEPESE